MRYNNIANAFLSEDGRSESIHNGLSLDGASHFEQTRDQRENIKLSLQNDLMMCDFEDNQSSLH